MRADLAHPGELGPDDVSGWRGLQQADPLLASPFLGPSFARVVGSVRADARVAVLEGGSGYFGFHRGRGRVGSPLGRTLGDYQALVAPRELTWTPRELVRACSLRSYAFDHAIVAQTPWRSSARLVERSPVLRLERFDPGEDMPSEAARKVRRLEREGEPRFVWHDAAPDALATLVRWKRDQYQRTGVYDIFRHTWVRELVDRLHAAAEPDLTAALACLYDGDELIGAHLFLRAGAVLHSWMPAHDPGRAKQSPGIVLLRAIVLDAPGRGVRVIDFGKGTQRYKLRFANDAIEVGTGSVQSLAALDAVAAAGRSAAGALNRTRLQGAYYRRSRRAQVG